MKTGNGNAPRDSATSSHVAERSPHRGRSLNIANLPAEIRDELNHRIAEGEEGIELVAWLNSKPEVAEVVNKLFDGTPISEQNLSEWRKRGYQKWLAHRNMFDESNALGDNAEEIAETGIDCDKLLLTLTAAYAESIQNWIITPGEQMLYKLAVYKNLTNGVIALQRAELQKVRLEIARERLELLREKRASKSPSASPSFTETASSSHTTPGSNQNGSESRHSSFELRHSSASAEVDSRRQGTPATAESLSALEGSPAASGSLPRAEVPTPAPPAEPPISQTIATPPPAPAPAPSTPAPQPNPCAHPTIRRSNVPRNAPPGTVISLNPLRIVPPRPIPHP